MLKLVTLVTVLQVLAAKTVTAQDLPTLYEHYVGDGISTGLVEDGTQFLLNDKPIQLISGSIHYFRIHPDYWRSSLRKLKACGMNAVITYVAWNLHEPIKDIYDFGDGDYDMSLFLDLSEFLRIAKEEELFVIVRPGPYICSEWDFGGLPSYLLRDPDMEVRTSYGPYMERVDAFYQRLIPILAEHQWTAANAGPVIAVQIENEYGSYMSMSQLPQDVVYLTAIRDMVINYGLDSVYFFFSDSPAYTGISGALEGYLMTANFQGSAQAQFDALKQLQPGRPLWAMELWAGWFDHWTEPHNIFPIDTTLADLNEIFSNNGSVNFYMFQGGTNFGFMNGANADGTDSRGYKPDTGSYDYDGSLAENGDYTEKYERVCALIQERSINPAVAMPERPEGNPRTAYPASMVTSFLTLEDLLSQNVVAYREDNLVNMENLGPTEQDGQDYGFILYRKTVELPDGVSTVTLATQTRDMVTVMVDGVHQIPPLATGEDFLGPGFWIAENPTVEIGGIGQEVTLDFLVENLGRVNFGALDIFKDQRRGFVGGEIQLNGVGLTDWEIRPLTFKSNWVNNLAGWRTLDGEPPSGPILVRAELVLQGDGPFADTWINLAEEGENVWNKGVAFINGFNLGRYWIVGPQQTLYLPGPFLKSGVNEILVFELYNPGQQVNFSDAPIFNSPIAVPK